MRLYLDASALVALCVRENHTPTARGAFLAASSLVASELAYPEAWAGLAAQRRAGRLTAPKFDAALEHLNAMWARVAAVELGSGISLVAGPLASLHALKGADAVHLATALYLHRQPEGLAVLTFDSRLEVATRAAGVSVWAP